MSYVHYQGSQPTRKTWNFVIFFSRPGKCLEFAQKVVETWNFNSKPGKNMKLANSMFQASLFKMSFTKIILFYFFVISTLSTQTLIQSQIDLGFISITWKIHGILCYKRSGNPASILTHFKIFVTKICMKVSGIWYTKPLKNLEFGIRKNVGTLIIYLHVLSLQSHISWRYRLYKSKWITSNLINWIYM